MIASEFVNEMNFDSFPDLFLEIKNIKWENRKDINLNKLISFINCSIMNFPEKKFEIKTVVTKKIIQQRERYPFWLLHNSLLPGDWWNSWLSKWLLQQKNSGKPKICYRFFANNLFSSVFFFVAKGMTLCGWRRKQINIGRNNLTNAQYVIIPRMTFVIGQKRKWKSKSKHKKDLPNIYRNKSNIFISF